MIFISTAPGNPSVCCLFVEASQFKKKLTQLSSNISRGDGQGREKLYIWKRKQWYWLYSFTVCWCEFPFQTHTNVINTHGPAFALFSTLYTTWTNESAKRKTKGIQSNWALLHWRIILTFPQMSLYNKWYPVLRNGISLG